MFYGMRQRGRHLLKKLFHSNKRYQQCLARLCHFIAQYSKGFHSKQHNNERKPAT